MARELGEAVAFHPLDVTDEQAWQELAAKLFSDPVNILVNNAGAVSSFVPLHELDPDDWERILALNLTSTFLGMHFIIPGMLKFGGGSVINMSSVSGISGHDIAPAYQAAKGGCGCSPRTEPSPAPPRVYG